MSGVDDYNTTADDNHICDLSYQYHETHITIQSNGLPNHDFHSVLRTTHGLYL